MNCIEANARVSPADECQTIMKNNADFSILSMSNRVLICNAIAEDAKYTQNSQNNTCAFVIVSTYNSFNDFYRGHESELATWQIQRINNDLTNFKKASSMTAK